MLRLVIILCFLLANAEQISAAEINKIIRGPYLQQLTDSSVILRWGTQKANLGIVILQEEGQAEQIIRSDNKLITKDHKILLSGLKPKTKYLYKIEDIVDLKDQTKRSFIKNSNQEQDFYFLTYPTEIEKLHVWVLGDPGVNGDRKAFDKKHRQTQYNVKNAYLKHLKSEKISGTDLILTLGDNAYSSGTYKEYNQGFFEPYADILSHTNLYTVFGNHDSGIDKKYVSYTARSYPKPRGVYYDLFSLPQPKAYYSFNLGSAHFVILDSFDSLWEKLLPDNSNYEKVWTYASEQVNPMLDWLKKDLAENQAQWTIVAFHHPPFIHDDEDDEKQDLWRSWMNAYVVPLLIENKVDLVLSGHIHNYQRSFPVNNLELKTDSIKNILQKNGKKLDEKSKKEKKRDFVEAYKKILQGLNLPEYQPIFQSNQRKTIFNKGQGTIFSIMGCSGSAFRSLVKTESMLYTARYQKAGSIILDIDSKKLTYTFLGDDGLVYDYFNIYKDKFK